MGRDKALLEWEGQPLWQIQLAKLRKIAPTHLLIACREEQSLHLEKADGVEWLLDPPGSDCGALGPIARALEQVDMPLLVLAVDMPTMSSAFLQSAAAQCSKSALFFRTGQGSEPLAGIYTPAMLPLMLEALQAGRYSLQRLLQQAEEQGLAIIQTVSASEATFFTNVNTPEEWQQAGA